MDRSSSSKVTVEYHDPSGLFPVTAPHLRSRLPLRNLHWKSPTRPLRSIDSLHVDLVPSQDSKDANAPAASQSPAEGSQGPTPRSSESGARDAAKGRVKERRHQIPGLRQTPYLKVYLFRCDDNDTYKSTARKALREWIKVHTPPSQSSSTVNTQEYHDAYEWLVLHVILPDTPAASQPRYGGSASSSSVTGEKTATGTRWPGRGSSTIFEKLRSDFNLSSKNAPDRIAQVRIPKANDQPERLDAPNRSSSPAYVESPQETQHAWNDLIAKFKSLILMSFNFRVSQYEDDIRERESQRALPGWNFCTFFVLKEGLARGFESVGLVEDALVGYDELSVGLDSVIREQKVKGDGFGGSFLTSTPELHDDIHNILERSKDGVSKVQLKNSNLGDRPIDSSRKSYRELILQNKISVFDFRCYIFARQMSLLLRMGNANTSRSQLMAKIQKPSDRSNLAQGATDDLAVGTKAGQPENEAEDLMSLATLCHRALSFVTDVARVLREDLSQIDESSSAHSQMIDNLVSSWSFSVAQQVMNETASSSVSITTYVKDLGTSSASKMLSSGGRGIESKAVAAEPKTMMHPVRSSSLLHRRPSPEPAYTVVPPSSEVVYDTHRHSAGPAMMQEHAPPAVKSGTEDLATRRAELYMLQRRVVVHIGESGGWLIGWAAILQTKPFQSAEYTEVSLSDEPTSGEAQPTERGGDQQPTVHDGPVVLGMCNARLSTAASSIDEFRGLYQNLSDHALGHYNVAKRNKSQETILGDLAVLKYELGDFAAASMYFHRAAPVYAESRWSLVETTMLKLHAHCLKVLNRKDDYAHVVLQLLAKAVAREKARLSRPKVMNKAWIDEDDFDAAGLVAELLRCSDELPYEVTVPLTKYFGEIHVEPYQHHFTGRDGFRLRLRLHHLLEESFTIQKAKVRLINSSEGQSREIWLESEKPFDLRHGVLKSWVATNITTFGGYIVDTIILQTGNIVFVHELFSKAEVATPLELTTSVAATSLLHAKKARILCYPRTGSFYAKLSQSTQVQIDKTRTIEIECGSGSNDIQSAELVLRSASAGLRLRTADTHLADGDVSINDRASPGVIKFSGLGPESRAVFKVPFDLESPLPELTIRIEVAYRTEKGLFHFLAVPTIQVELPLDVNVHDAFRHDMFWPVFNIGPAGEMPLAVVEVGLEGSDIFNVSSTCPEGDQLPRQLPGCMATSKRPKGFNFAITRKISVQEEVKKHGKDKLEPHSLPLTVKYECLDELVLAEAERHFSNAVKDSAFASLGELLMPTFVANLKANLSPPDIARCVYQRAVKLVDFESFAWSDTLACLPHPLSGDLKRWLQDWHENTKSIPFHAETWQAYTPGLLCRQIIIPVSIPHLHVLHTATLSLHALDRSPTNLFPAAPVGVPFAAELRIRHTRQWGDPAALAAAAALAHPDDPVDFVYDVETNPDLWLVCGARRAAFRAREGEERRFPLLLMPLRAGELPYPTIDVRPRFPARKASPRGGGLAPVSTTHAHSALTVNTSMTPTPGAGTEADRGRGGEEEETEIACETNYWNQGMAVRAVPNWRSTTVGVGSVGDGGGKAVLVEAETRVGEVRIAIEEDSVVPGALAHWV